MLSKYEESANSAISIEAVVGNLMEELGFGGFMGVDDVQPGMKISISMKGTDGRNTFDSTGEVISRNGKDIFVCLNSKDKVPTGNKDGVSELRIVVDNVLYHWNEVKISESKEPGSDYKLFVDSNPKVYNRRKYPRMPLTNPCQIYLKELDKTYSGKMVNISANGIAFSVRFEEFVAAKGKKVTVTIADFDILKGKKLEGNVIRCSNNAGEYIVGCRMPEDNDDIKEYVSKNYSE